MNNLNLTISDICVSISISAVYFNFRNSRNKMEIVCVGYCVKAIYNNCTAINIIKAETLLTIINNRGNSFKCRRLESIYCISLKKLKNILNLNLIELHLYPNAQNILDPFAAE